ncbi:BrnT family toxin [Endozoicomonas euniceicola]|uniref:BrnT family toxin n=1 Tax=Endozoicomonas euniceicola TaxID=1234143 RepID=A0ABY6GMM6_9GAMM|nr:BrnT family toxin [Endozoicomonas euniceicola]UYM13958.1 BrnT family toxin [Endozoicomonas euniceicola]
MSYEWDESKRIVNLQKHGVDFGEVYLFDWNTATLSQDNRKNYGEIRVKAKGFIEGRLHELVFNIRGGNIRVIGLRKANQREVKEYERRTQKARLH